MGSPCQSCKVKFETEYKILTNYLCFAALAGGTLLYVVMFEVLQREKEKDVSGALQLVGILLGFSFMTMLQTLGRPIMKLIFI